MSYRISRNLEASLIDWITSSLTSDGWTGIRVEKVFSEVYEGTLPCILINVSDRPDTRREIGSDTLSKYINVELRIFATSDGQRLDLADWLLEKIMSGVSYYSYTIVNGVVSTKVLAGMINILEIISNRKEVRITDNIEKEDRYRQLISLKTRVSLS